MPTCQHPAHPAHRPCGPRGQRLGIPSRGGGWNSRDQPGVQGEAAFQLRPRERLRDPQGTQGSEAEEGRSAARPWLPAQTGGPEPTRRRGDASAGCGAHGLRGAETAHSGGPTLSGRRPTCRGSWQSTPSPHCLPLQSPSGSWAPPLIHLVNAPTRPQGRSLGGQRRPHGQGASAQVNLRGTRQARRVGQPEGSHAGQERACTQKSGPRGHGAGGVSTGQPGDLGGERRLGAASTEEASQSRGALPPPSR